MNRSEEQPFSFELEIVEADPNEGNHSAPVATEASEQDRFDEPEVPLPRFLPHRVWTADGHGKPLTDEHDLIKEVPTASVKPQQLALPPVEAPPEAPTKPSKSLKDQLKALTRRRRQPKSPEVLENERVKREQRRLERQRRAEGKRNREQRQQTKKERQEQKKEERRRERALKNDQKKRSQRQITTSEQAQKRQQRDLLAPLQQLPWIGIKIRNYRDQRQREKAANAELIQEKRQSFAALRQRFTTLRATHARRLGSNITGLEIGSGSLRAVLLDGQDTITVLEHRLPEGIIVDGLLEEPEELTRELKAFWQETGISSKKINFSLANRLVTLCTTQLPAQRDSDVPQALGLKADVLLAPMNPEESIIDYAELSRSGPTRSLQVAAADEEMVKKFAKAIEKAGLLAVSCEIGALATGRALRIPYSAREAHMVIDIGQETTSIIAASGTDIFYYRNLDIGVNNFTEALRKRLQCSWSDAESLKKRAGLGSQPADPTLSSEQFQECRDIMRSVSDQLCQEIEQTKRHWEQSEQGRPVTSWSILGGGSLMNGLIEQIGLFTNLDKPMLLTPFPGLEEASDLNVQATALGLAKDRVMSLLPAPDPLNFNVAVPGIRRRSKVSLQRSRREAKRLATHQREQRASPKLIAFAICLAVLGGGYFYGFTQKDGVDQLKQEVEALSTAGTTMSIYQAPTYSNSQSSTETASMLFAQPVFRTLSSFSRTLEQSGAEQLEITQAENGILRIRGVAADETQVQMMQEKLIETPGVNGLTASQPSPVGTGISFEFQVASGPSLNLEEDDE